MRSQVLSLGLLASLTTAARVIPRSSTPDDTPLPVVIWHGLGDAFNAEGIQSVATLIESLNPGTLVYPISLAADTNGDRSASFLGNVTAQIDTVCAALATHPILSTAPAIDALGFSQGGAFLRGYVERCNQPPVRSLVTFGSPHAGISKFKECAMADFVCKGAMALLNFNKWSAYVQSRLVPAQYYRDLEDYESYLGNSAFLADVNNERAQKHPEYKENMAALEAFVMYEFADDSVLIPKETAWFGEVNGTETVPLKHTKLYTEDWIGLRELDRSGRLHFRTVPGEHMSVTDEALTDVIKKFFGPYEKEVDDATTSFSEL